MGTRWILLIFGFFVSIEIKAYVLFNGPSEAKLAVSRETPHVNFVWNGTAPTIKKKEEFANGAYTNLEDIAFMEVLLGEAMKVWNDVRGAYIDLGLDKDPSIGLSSEDRIMAIVVQKEKNLTTAAFASPIAEGSTIVDCDIVIADKKVAAKDLVYTMAHEIGHCLGFGHEHSDYGSIMGYARTGEKLSLGVDDKIGLIHLYPEDDDPPPLVCGVVGGRTSPLSLWWGFLSFGLLVAFRLGLLVRKPGASRVESKCFNVGVPKNRLPTKAECRLREP